MYKALQHSVAFLLVIILVSTQALLAQVQNDSDLDGVSDITYISGSSGSLVWTRIPSLTSTAEDGVTFGSPTDTVVMGHWQDELTVNFGVIRPDAVRGVLVWKILTPDRRIESVEFGKPGDVILAGADFDGNGIGDAAVVRLQGENLAWFIKLNLFVVDSEPKKIIFGKNHSRVFFLNLEGERDWLGVFSKSKGKKKRGVMRLRKYGGGSVRKFAGFPKHLVDGAALLRPFPIAQLDGTDLVGFVNSDGIDTVFYVYNMSAELINKDELSGTGDMAVGDYDAGDDGEEILFQSNSELNIYNPVSDALVVEDVVGGDIIDEITVQQVGTPTPIPTATPIPSPTP